MIVTPTLALAGLLALGGPAYVGTQQPAGADTLTGPGSAVPYVDQGPLLCGGASAAMVERFWGALGVYAEDYAPLVDHEAGGIHARDLVGALERRGFRVQVIRDPDAALARVRDGIPVIALLRSGASRYHYVVVVAAGPDAVRYHDPLLAPGRSAGRAAFLDRWEASGYWALAAAPGPPALDPAAAPDSSADPGAQRPTEPDSLPPALQSALEALRAGYPDTAATRVERWLAGAGNHRRRDLAREILATARYLAGDATGALRAWNPAAPTVDLVQVQGLRAQRYRTVVDPLGIRPGDILTPASLRLARRRVSQLPAVAVGRVDYRPLRNGAVEVDVALMERRPAPLAVPELLGVALGALANQRAGVEVGPFLGVGERWRVAGSWDDATPLAAGEVAIPWPPLAAVVTIGAGWTEERFVTGSAERTWGDATLRRWLSPGVRAGLSLGVERWDGSERIGRVGLSVLLAPLDALRLGTAVDGWTGAARAARVRAGAELRSESVGPRREEATPLQLGRAWTVALGGSLASGDAPPTLWDGAGTGRVRGPLLRGHPLLRDGRIGAAAFGRGLAYATAGHSWFARAGLAQAEIQLFVDAARVWDPLAGAGPRSYVDPGVELRLTADDRVAAVSLARGAGWVLAVRVETGRLPWLRGPVW